ncbi:AaceriAER074Wp [[Ashbya] aceris (nom. inval.)]|nr:AaceriAER074Wp [[Ashbya] aceris (nom. inval.)]
MEEPAAKRPKLSDRSEPLTQRDVVLFQKEALFRQLNRYRAEAHAGQVQVEELRRAHGQVGERLAAVCGVVRSIARAVADAGGDEDARALCERVAGGDDDEVVARAAEFAAVVAGGLGRGAAAGEGWHRLEALNSRLAAENAQLAAELGAVRGFYTELLRRYDREESETVRRVFKVEESEPPRAATPVVESSAKGAASDGEAAAAAVEREMQFEELQTEIRVLEDTVAQLTEWKRLNEQEVTKLRQMASSAELSQRHHTPPSAGSSPADLQALRNKVDKLSNENKELAQLNEAYLGKFHQLSADREIFNNRLSAEFQTAQETLKKHNSNLEKDLVRIRTARDELLSKVAVLEAQKSKSDMLEDLEKMLALQQEQLKALSDHKTEPARDAVMKELQDLEKAFKELSQYSNKKYSEYVNQESLMSKLTVEKTKADQKYYAAMRSKDSILIENKNLSKNLSKSNELIQQLKDIEQSLQAKIENLNKQLHISRINEKRLLDSNKATSLKIMDLTSQLSKANKSSALIQQECNKLIEEKAKMESKLNDLEIETKNLATKLTYQENKSKKLHKTLVSNGGDNGALAEELENFRTVVYCSLCSKNWKDTVIKSCGHVFCADCCKERLAARMRKCPTCNKGFSSNDLLVVHL